MGLTEQLGIEKEGVTEGVAGGISGREGEEPEERLAI